MQDRLKRAAAEQAVSEIKDGMVVGLGTGSTAALMVEALGRRLSEGLRIIGIPTSEKTAEQARSLGILLATLGQHPEIDLTIDGADEVERSTLNLIKGLGGALLREKIVACASKRYIIIVDESKLVDRLGSKSAIPVEVVTFGWEATARHLRAMGAKPDLRMKGGQPFTTDGGHYILDCAVGPMESPESIASSMDRITGIVDHGLFLGLNPVVYVGTASGVQRLPEPRP